MKNSKPPLLYLVHRIPFPPNKGDKIRSFHLLRYLSRHFSIYLGAFIDDSNDRQYIEQVKQYCHEVFLPELNTTFAKIRSTSGLLTRSALTLPYYYKSSMQQWVDQTIAANNIENAVVYCSSMAQYLEKHSGLNRLLDMVDVDSDKWRQYADSKSGLAKWIYQRESKMLAHVESECVASFDKTYLVSEKEAQLLQQRNPDLSSKVDYFNNGADLTFFDPSESLDNPYPSDKTIIAFTGAMDYWANEDAVKWFVNNVLPSIKQRLSNVVFYIVGSNPSNGVKALASDDVVVTGRVEDIRSYLAYADLLVAPMQIARGIQNKVLEALAMNKKVIMTPAAYEGLVEHEQLNQWCTSDPFEFAEKCLKALKEDVAFVGRQYVDQHYSWSSCLSRIESQLFSTQQSAEAI